MELQENLSLRFVAMLGLFTGSGITWGIQSYLKLLGKYISLKLQLTNYIDFYYTAGLPTVDFF
jgi:hypothetical protein